MMANDARPATTARLVTLACAENVMLIVRFAYGSCLLSVRRRCQAALSGTDGVSLKFASCGE